MRVSSERRRNAARSAPTRPSTFHQPSLRDSDGARPDAPSIFIGITETATRFAFSRSSAVALTLVGGMALAGLAHAQTNAGPQNPGSAQGGTQATGSEPPHGNPGPTGDTGA